MPIQFTFDSERHRVEASADGPVSYVEIAVHLSQERGAGLLPFSELIDGTHGIPTFTPAQVRDLVSILRSLGAEHALGPTAVVVGSDFAYGMMRMIELLTEDVCQIRPFRSRAEAES
jgi:hypothetical protein